MNPQQSKWFKKLRPLLQSLGGDYWPGSTNTVVHTDFASPLATTQKWGNLDVIERRLLQVTLHGCDIWHKLICILEPRLILFTGGKADLDEIRFEHVSVWQDIDLPHRSSSGKLHGVQTSWMQLPNGDKVHVAFSRNNINGPYCVGKANQLWLGASLAKALAYRAELEHVDSEKLKSAGVGSSRQMSKFLT